MKKVILMLITIDILSCADNEKIIQKVLTKFFKGLKGINQPRFNISKNILKPLKIIE